MFCWSVYAVPQVDVKVVKEAKGRVYYFEHLPLLGETKVPRRGSVAVGDYVRVGMQLDAFRRNQTGHGGWCEAMLEVGGEWMWFNLTNQTFLQHVSFWLRGNIPVVFASFPQMLLEC